jgi:3-hydroxybutyryl-CoA dehydrogenase
MAVVGPGMIGSHVAVLGMRRGLDVVLIGRDEARSRALLARTIAGTGDRIDAARCDIRTDIAAVGDADIVYEAIHERLLAKREVFARIEALIGADVPIVSGTSSISPADLGAEMRHPDRIFVAHFVHPVTTVALTEVLEPASPNATARATFESWLAAMQLQPLVLEKAVQGFIVNRLQFAILREAISLVVNGVADARDIDRVITDALGPRWVATGPLASMDLGGMELLRDVAGLVAPTLENGTMVDHIQTFIDRGTLGAAGGEGFRKWDDGQIPRAIDARKRSYAFAAELHAGGPVPDDDPG